MILYITDRNIRVDNADNQISYNLDYIAEFRFDEEWNGKVKTARFIQNKEYFDVVLADDRCEIPPLKTGFVRVGVFSDSMTSTYADVYFKTSIKDGSGNPSEPPEDVYKQLIELIESGMLKGDDGLTPYVGSNNNWWIGSQDTRVLACGTNGEPGYTPQKGVDYWTPIEVEEIVTKPAEAESERAVAETARSTAETARANAEQSREVAESNRAKAETLRANAETSRSKAESSREAAEQGRAKAESDRALAEQGRTNAESERVSAEQLRAAAETERAGFYEGFNSELNSLKSELTHISNIVSTPEPQETLNRSGYAIYQGSDGWKFGYVGTEYDLYFFRMEEGYIYEVSFTGGQKRIGYTNYNPPTGTAYDIILISNGYTFEKHPTYNYFAIGIYGDSTVTITKRKKLTEVADATNLKHNITDRFTFTSGKCVIANSSNSSYGKVVDNATTDASNAALITDCNKLLINCATVLMSDSAQNIGVCFYDGVLNVIGGAVNLDAYAARNAPIMVEVPSGAFYVRVTVWNDEGLTPFYCYGYSDKNRISASDWDKAEYHIVRIAASNASARSKELADYVCTGTNDEAVIQKAIKTNFGIYRLRIELSEGDFYIDSFTNYNGKYIALELCGLDWSLIFKRTFCGAGMFTEQRTVIHVTQTALTGLGNNVGYVFSIKNAYAYGRIACYEDMEIRLADNQHKVIVIDNTEMSGGICKNVRLGGCDPIVANLSDLPLPIEGCVGITGYVGDDIGTINRWDNIASLNFYEAFRMGGEHLICNNLTARNNYIGYTFGNYDWPSGTQSHPLTLINCCDEHNACLPKFYRSGNYNQVAQKAKQQVDLIGFNMELSRGEVFGGGYVEPSTEAVDGAFCGRIEFTGNGHSNVDSGETAGVRNLKAIKFWADGHGHGFRTYNMAHSLAGTTAERETYEPTYMQQYFDTTLNKMLIYNGSAWVDMNGNLLT